MANKLHDVKSSSESVQAAQKALAEIEAIPEAILPLHTSHQDVFTPASMQHMEEDNLSYSRGCGAGEELPHTSDCRAADTGTLRKINKCSARDMNGGSQQRPSSAPSRRRWAPLQHLDSNADAPSESAADTAPVSKGPQSGKAGQQHGVQSTVGKPRGPKAASTHPRRRAAVSMDFGVQVYAPERPQDLPKPEV